MEFHFIRSNGIYLLNWSTGNRRIESNNIRHIDDALLQVTWMHDWNSNRNMKPTNIFAFVETAKYTTEKCVRLYILQAIDMYRKI